MMARLILTYLFVLFLFPVLPDAQAAPLLQRDSEIREAVTSYITQKTAHLGHEIRVRKLTMSGPTELPDGPIDYEVAAPQQWEGWGNANITVFARQGSRVLRNIPVRVEVEALAEMVVTVRQIDHGSIITSEDVVVKRWDVSGMQGKYVGKISDAVGKKARSTLRPNAPLKSDQLEKIALIRSGQAVTILAESGNMKITVTGRARSAGAAGDTISVQNLDSLKEFPARIIDAKTVAILF
jgi:flagella basal body P-ring formation protein FlgA